MSDIWLAMKMMALIGLGLFVGLSYLADVF
jgi:hypothetical protein